MNDSAARTESLLRAYRQMKLIREFEERLHVEIATGEIPGFTHLYAGQEAIAVGVCDQLSDADYIVSTHRGHGHCIAKGCDVDRHDEGDLWAAGRPVPRQGRLHAHCRHDQGHAGRERHRRRRSPDRRGRRDRLQAARQPPCQRRVRRRRQRQSGHGVRGDEHGRGAQGAGHFRLENNGYSEHTGAAYAVGSRDLTSRSAAFGMPAERVDGADFRPCTTPWAAR
jgi:TPP-dependent pyruvate/acetoin dehydrogenase alpha subunit